MQAIANMTWINMEVEGDREVGVSELASEPWLVSFVRGVV